ncbi:MAG: MBL fold metallo-hydrolase [Acidobacteriota bacterium]
MAKANRRFQWQVLWAWGLAIALVLSGSTALAEDNGAGAPLEVTFLANEGVLLSSGKGKVILDGLVTEPYTIYGAVPESVFESMVAGKEPFAGVDLVLASHVHRDHFQGEPTLTYLRAQRQARLISSLQVVEALRQAEGEAAGEDELPQARVEVMDGGEAGRQEVVAAEGAVRVVLMELAHGGARHRTIQNLGHLVTLGDWTVLHVGDADLDPEVFRRQGIHRAGVDVAVLPFWYLLQPEAVKALEELLGEVVLVVTHVPPKDVEAVAEKLAETLPEAWVPRRALESRRFD